MLKAQDISFAYHAHNPVLQHVSAEIVPGSFLAILGVNGCGKSTFLSCLTHMLKPKSGYVYLNDQSLTHISRSTRAQNIAFVEQHSHAGQLTVFDAVLLGRKPYISSAPKPEDLQVVSEVLDHLGLAEYSLRSISELSGGEYQKVMLARALSQDTPVLLLDEPTNNLDPANQQSVMRELRLIADTRNCAVAAVLHDINLALQYCDRFMLMANGRVYSYGGKETITQQSIYDVYGLKADIIYHNNHPYVIAC